jgi:hypothetical protein
MVPVVVIEPLTAKLVPSKIKLGWAAVSLKNQVEVTTAFTPFNLSIADLYMIILPKAELLI